MRWRTGDIILTHTRSSFFGKLIRFGQRLRYRGEDKPFAWFNHAAVVIVGGNGVFLAEALADGIKLTDPDSYHKDWYAYVSLDLPEDEREDVYDYAMRTVELNTKYGWLQIIAIALSLITNGRLRFGVAGQNICSGFAAETLRAAGYWWERNGRMESSSFLTPADLASSFNTQAIRGLD